MKATLKQVKAGQVFMLAGNVQAVGEALAVRYTARTNAMQCAARGYVRIETAQGTVNTLGSTPVIISD